MRLGAKLPVSEHLTHPPLASPAIRLVLASAEVKKLLWMAILSVTPVGVC